LNESLPNPGSDKQSYQACFTGSEHLQPELWTSFENVEMSKKEANLKTAANLFVAQGFDGATTVQIAPEAGVTEPFIYYHFTGKDELLTHIHQDAFAEYPSPLNQLNRDNDTHFENIQDLIDMHFDLVNNLVTESLLNTSVCPAVFRNPEDLLSFCRGKTITVRNRIAI
jgi:AcrR family transcriptional regulator